MELAALTPEQLALFNQHLPMCEGAAGRFTSTRPALASHREDFEQEARIRLLWCVRNFDPASGQKFVTYAYLKVWQAILKSPEADRYGHWPDHDGDLLTAVSSASCCTADRLDAREWLRDQPSLLISACLTGTVEQLRLRDHFVR